MHRCKYEWKAQAEAQVRQAHRQGEVKSEVKALEALDVSDTPDTAVTDVVDAPTAATDAPIRPWSGEEAAAAVEAGKDVEIM